MNRRLKWIGGFFLLLVLGLCVWLPFFGPDESGIDSKRKEAEESPVAEVERDRAVPPAEEPSVLESAEVIYLSGQLENGASQGSKRAAWRQLVEIFLRMDRAEAVKWLRAFLESGADGATGFVFEVGKSGTLLTAPTWRIFALDLLGRIDPVVAFELAVVGLERVKTSADEHALHLRNYAWGAQVLGRPERQVKSYLLEKVSGAIAEPAWFEDPSNGYSEMYDVIVWADGIDLVEPLGALAGAAEPGISKPAVMVLDRLIIAEPLAVLQRLVQSAAWKGTPAQRATLIGRVDLEDEAQRELVEVYFEAIASDEERKDYLNALPALDFVLSDNLLSEHRFFSYETILSRLKGAESMLLEWRNDPRYLRWQGEIDERLEWIEEVFAQKDR